MISNQALNRASRAIPKLNPDYLWRMAKHKAPLMEIGVFRNDRKTVCLGVNLNSGIWRFLQPDIPHVLGTDEDIS